MDGRGEEQTDGRRERERGRVGGCRRTDRRARAQRERERERERERLTHTNTRARACAHSHTRTHSLTHSLTHPLTHIHTEFFGSIQFKLDMMIITTKLCFFFKY